MARLLSLSSSVQSASGSDADTSSDQIVFIDPTVLDDQSLVDGIARGTQVYLLDADEDGL